MCLLEKSMSNINPEKLTEKSIEAVNGAREIAKVRGNTEILPLHLLASLVAQEGGIVGLVLNRLGSDKRAALELGIKRALDSLPSVSGDRGEPYANASLSQVFDRAEALARQMRDDYVSTEHLFMSIVEKPEPESIAALLRSLKISKDSIMETVKSMRGNAHVDTKTPENTYEALEKYGVDLVKLARDGKLDPVIGRDDEMASSTPS